MSHIATWFTHNMLKRLAYTLLACLIGLPLLYLVIAFILSSVTVNKQASTHLHKHTKTIYLSTNGVHLDIVIHSHQLSPDLARGLKRGATYYAFGWGDENFYLNTPTWADLTLKNGVSALFLNSSSLMHVTRFSSPLPHSDWVAVALTPQQLNQLNKQIVATFQTNANGQKIHIVGAGYTATDDFYKAHGSYSLAHTCNTWVNASFKKSGLKASYWTPFDVGLLNKYNPDSK